jgi:hypothetical protein
MKDVVDRDQVTFCYLYVGVSSLFQCLLEKRMSVKCVGKNSDMCMGDTVGLPITFHVFNQ